MTLTRILRGRQFVSASAAMLTVVLALGASPAFAADTTWQAQRQAYVSAMQEYRAAAIDRHIAINAIRATFLKSAQSALALPKTERRAAITTARSIRDAAIAALPPLPTKPVKPVKPAATTAPAPTGTTS